MFSLHLGEIFILSHYRSRQLVGLTKSQILRGFGISPTSDERQAILRHIPEPLVGGGSRPKASAKIGDTRRFLCPLRGLLRRLDAETAKGQINHDIFGIMFGINIGINETQQKIVALMVANPEITAGQLADSIGVTKRQIESSISKLKSLEIVERVGARKNGHWVVKQID